MVQRSIRKQINVLQTQCIFDKQPLPNGIIDKITLQIAQGAGCAAYSFYSHIPNFGKLRHECKEGFSKQNPLRVFPFQLVS